MDIPLDGMGFVSIPASEIISPVFTLWTTLVIMYIGEPIFTVICLLGHCNIPGSVAISAARARHAFLKFCCNTLDCVYSINQ